MKSRISIALPMIGMSYSLAIMFPRILVHIGELTSYIRTITKEYNRFAALSTIFVIFTNVN